MMDERTRSGEIAAVLLVLWCPSKQPVCCLSGSGTSSAATWAYGDAALIRS